MNKTIKDIDKFIDRLSKLKVTKNATNLYKGNSRESLIRKENLKIYLHKMARLKPKKLMLGEAPGYKGCGNTGIPFTSERVLSENEFFKEQGYKCIHEHPNLESEASATIVWNVLQKYAEKPLIWNIYPFHPHSVDCKNNNRTPKKTELMEGKNILIELLNIYPTISTIIAVGRKAEYQIKDLEYDHVYIRHPANGGKNKFIDGLKDLFQ